MITLGTIGNGVLTLIAVFVMAKGVDYLFEMANHKPTRKNQES